MAKDPRTEEIEDLKLVMGTENGRRFVYRFLVRSGLYICSYSSEMPVENTVFKEGQRNMGLWLLAELNQSTPKAYLKMIEENNNVT